MEAGTIDRKSASTPPAELAFVFAGTGRIDEEEDKCKADCSPGTSANTKAMHDTKP